MKKLGAILITFIYLTFSVGLLVNLHYCQGEIEEVRLIVENSPYCDEASSCCSDSDNEKDMCCSEIQHYYQVVPEILKAEQINLIISNDDITFSERELFSDSQIPGQNEQLNNYFDAPPEALHESLWVMLCSSIIYG